jgi:hypothetical protein
MTRIYRIPTSQVDGNDSNANNTNEIRPYGEIGLFRGDNDKLELLMFDGTRTHAKSKVLNKGTLYGGDADSGDGVGFDTIKLVPDAILKGQGSEQYLIIDPTYPNHIHIRAGGTQDNSSADLFIGGEQTHVKVSDGNDSVTVRTSFIGEGITEYNWTFDSAGDLTVPNYIKFNSSTFIGDVSGGEVSVFRICAAPSHGIMLTSDFGEGNSNKTWYFDTTGYLMFPDSTVQSTAWAGGRIVNAPNTSKGAVGDLAGDMAFDNNYIYRCTANYAVVSYNTTLTRETNNSSVFYIPDFDEFQNPTGGTLQFNPGAGGQIVNIISAEIDGTEWALTLDTNGSAGLGTPVKITLSNSDIWRRIQWSGNSW